MAQPVRPAPSAFSPTLDAHLPADRRQALARGLVLPERAAGSVLMADVSGFTPLMEHLANTLGPQQGAEELTFLLNALFAPLVGLVHRYGGSVIAFGGDALTCWFPALSTSPHSPGPPPLPHRGRGGGEGGGEGSARRAALCALEMQRQVAAFGRQKTSAGLAALSMHVGIASGDVRRFVVGRPPHGRHDVLAGATMERCTEAQSRASAGKVVVDTATAAMLPAEAREAHGGGFFLLTGAPTGLPSLPEGGPISFPPLAARQVRHWLAATLQRRLQAGGAGYAAELRLVTSLFVRFAGLDFENDLQAGRKLQRYVALAQERLSPYEGYLAMVACGERGGILHILFGAPVSHEDDPSRAVGFALEFQEKVRALPFLREQRVGVSMGRVYAGLLGSTERCTYTILGDEVNVSARLMAAAAPGQVLVSRHVQRAATDFAFRSLGAVAVKGREEMVPALEPLASQECHPEEEVLVGREAEQRAIAALLSQVATGHGQVLLLVGEAGVGKSALVRAMLRQALERGWRGHTGACLSYGQHIPYLPWRLLLEEVYGLAGLTPAERVVRLEGAVAALPDPPGRPGYWQARFPLLAESMGLEVADTSLTRALEGELRRDNTFQILEALVRSWAEPGPLAIVLEDAYWADELSLALAAHIGRGLVDVPLLLALVSRPSTREVPPAVEALRSLPALKVLDLQPLAEGAAMELACQRLRAADLPRPLLALLREKARGNPFFIEELLRSLQEAGCLRHTDGTVELARDWEHFELPDTIEGVVQARLDRLPEEERLTVKVAAAIGRSFPRPLLQEVHPARPSEAALVRQLQHLERAEFAMLEEGPPIWRYAFLHPILHEVAYGSLLFAQRRQLHGAIGAALEARYAGDLPQVLDLLAYHYARSEEREKAVHYLQRAAEKACREYANEVALVYYGQALERLFPEEQAERYDLLAGRERILDLLGRREAQESDLRQMARIARALGAPHRQVEVLNRRARRAADMGDFDRARRLALRAGRYARKHADAAGAARAQRILGIVHGMLGEYGAAHRAFSRACESYRALGDRAGEASCLGNLGTVHLYRGDWAEEQAHHARALELFRALGDRLEETKVLINMGLAAFQRGEYEQAMGRYQEALTISREIGSAGNEEIALGNLGDLATTLGRLTEAAAYQEQALHLARELQDREGEAAGLTGLGLIAACQGDREAALSLLQQALQHDRAMGHRREEARVWHTLGLAELWAGRPAAAREPLRQALAIREELGDGGNALLARAWLGLAEMLSGEEEQARNRLAQVMAELRSEGYRGDSPEQEVWWAIYGISRGLGEEEGARAALERARRLVREQAERIRAPQLRRSFLENVPVNREIVRVDG